MSRPIFIGRVEGPSLRISDEWRYHKDAKGEVTEVLCFININGSWGDLQTIITTVTSDDMKKIVKKLIVFFKVSMGHQQIQALINFRNKSKTAKSSGVKKSMKPQRPPMNLLLMNV
jgi:hypothetical protein